MKKTQLHGLTMAKMVESMMGAHDATAAINQKLAGAALAVLNLEKMAASQNPMETSAAHARRVASAAQKLSDKIHRIESELTVEAEHQHQRLQREIQEKARLVPSQHAAEIRSALRSADEKTRLKTIRDALKEPESGAEILAAIAEGNSVTVGLADDVRRRFVEDFQRIQAPELFAEQADLEETIRLAPKVLKLASEAVTDAVDPEYIIQINEAEQRAQEITAAFDQSVA